MENDIFAPLQIPEGQQPPAYPGGIFPGESRFTPCPSLVLHDDKPDPDDDGGDFCFLCWISQQPGNYEMVRALAEQKELIAKHLGNKPPNVFCEFIQYHYNSSVVPSLKPEHQHLRWSRRMIWEHVTEHTSEEMYRRYKTIAVYDQMVDTISNHCMFKENEFAGTRDIDPAAARLFVLVEAARSRYLESLSSTSDGSKPAARKRRL